ncbi:uncharacterized protein SPAPADRAFT_49099 [Spathaspora passalidarum NRRL Y-27907]|uniref:Uncharacterized protein n=1 Tax=Spathaspora passalidarum (strain NRRL Y-27907 / 11-Y1) TaxID=619300 RepID=G3AJW4_SPAPN|nr:uncharacterized protein SPAPADRAFT_49099 [Spathaspora passalidarum NRRL Y-27907]EGW34015.1 hypothetical protein SPAPADRAFT_49099 [Spathaspora passalidarum NRRL Y-27907]
MKFAPIILTSFIALASASHSEDNFMKLLQTAKACSPDCEDVVKGLGSCRSKKADFDSDNDSDHESFSDSDSEHDMRGLYNCICHLGDKFFDEFSTCVKKCPDMVGNTSDEDLKPKNLKKFYCDAADANSNPARTSFRAGGVSKTESNSGSSAASTEATTNGAQLFDTSMIKLLGAALVGLF